MLRSLLSMFLFLWGERTYKIKCHPWCCVLQPASHHTVQRQRADHSLVCILTTMASFLWSCKFLRIAAPHAEFFGSIFMTRITHLPCACYAHDESRQANRSLIPSRALPCLFWSISQSCMPQSGCSSIASFRKIARRLGRASTRHLVAPDQQLSKYSEVKFSFEP